MDFLNILFEIISYSSALRVFVNNKQFVLYFPGNWYSADAISVRWGRRKR